jgi:hypothetical protein
MINSNGAPRQYDPTSPRKMKTARVWGGLSKTSLFGGCFLVVPCICTEGECEYTQKEVP